MQRHGLTVTGQVQGVGFRPFVYRTATRLGLTGHVGNTSHGVRIELQGAPDAIAAFRHALHADLPPLARIATLTEASLPLLADEGAFTIAESHGEAGQSVLISPDMGTCAACLAELFDPTNRRYLYPFINCTDCGPRLTITRSIPYDRASTSMACFPQCPQCLAEYTDPGHRRFHAQPNACPVCGPRLWLAAPDGTQLEGDVRTTLDRAVDVLAQGGIVGIKGLGGFHLVCDAHNGAALTRLRERKGRLHQSLAVMTADLAAARRLAMLDAAEEAELTSARRPIVAVRGRAEADGGLPALVAPDLVNVGLMLPYTPLHHVLLHLFDKAVENRKAVCDPTPRKTGCKPTPRKAAALVMTSGNPRGEPLCLGNREAIGRLGQVADVFVLHDRDILVRADDSVVRMTEAGERRFMRRARGFVPNPLPVPVSAEADGDKGDKGANGTSGASGTSGTKPPETPESADVLAVGAELKNTICLTRGRDAFVSQHLGDMTNLATHGFFLEIVDHFKRLLEVEPGLFVRDAHPDYQTGVWAAEEAAAQGRPVLAVQHHAAHIHSVLAEHGHSGPALGLALDGAGYGPAYGVGDAAGGTVWGGELLLVHPAMAGREAEWAESALDPSVPCQMLPGGLRLGRLGLMPLPGGDAAVREPWRLACGLLTLAEAEGDIEGAALFDERVMPWLGSVDVCGFSIISTSHVAFSSGQPPAGPQALHTAGPPVSRVAHEAVAELVRRGRGPLTSSCGRLFDAVAAVLGLCSVVSYEGQAAIRLETCQQGVKDNAPLRPRLRNTAMPCQTSAHKAPPLLELDSRDLFRQVVTQRLDGVPVPVIARRFHAGLAAGLADLARLAADRTGITTVGLSGGVMHNATLERDLETALRARNLTPLLHHNLPPGDGGLAYGQAAYGKLWLQNSPDTRIVG